MLRDERMGWGRGGVVVMVDATQGMGWGGGGVLLTLLALVMLKLELNMPRRLSYAPLVFHICFTYVSHICFTFVSHMSHTDSELYLS